MKAARPALFILLVSVIFISGCASGVKFKKITKEEMTQAVQAPSKTFRIGEKLTYGVRWNGLYVGSFTSQVVEKTKVNGRDAYHIIAKGESHTVLDLIYKVKNTYDSYIDAQTFCSLKFERDVSEGLYKAREATEYDQQKHLANTTNLNNNEKSDFEVPADTQDMVSCLYYLRMLELDPGKQVTMNVNIRKKNYELFMDILGFEHITIKKLGSFDAFKIEPKAAFKGIFIDKGKGNIWVMTSDARIPLVARMKIVPFGSIVCTLEKIE